MTGVETAGNGTCYQVSVEGQDYRAKNVVVATGLYQQRGVSEYPGLYFPGLPWLYKQKSGLLVGVGEDTEYLAAAIAKDGR